MSKSNMRKINCWEYMKCGSLFGEKGLEAVCPVRREKGLHDIHGGMNAGRACWVVPETLCYGFMQGSFGAKFKNCRKCTFYIKVRMEEGINFTMPTALLNMRDARTAARSAAEGSGGAETQDVNLQSENADTVT